VDPAASDRGSRATLGGNLEEVVMARNGRIRKFVKPFRVDDGSRFRLKDYDASDARGIDSRDKAEKVLAKGVDLLCDLQEKLYAQDRWGVLLIFQAMDAAGKDGAIKHVMSGINPQGCQVFSFKAPTSEDLDHDFLWRTAKCLPERGRIGIFNRSYYEEVLVVRVHPEILDKQKLPKQLVGKNIWKQRYEDIAAHERYLARNGVLVLKFFLNVSKAEQKRRFLERLEKPEKNWKFSSADAKERGFWKQYMSAYEDMIRATAAPHAPWYVVPADKKWYARLVVAAAVADGLQSLDLAFPKVDAEQRKQLELARVALEGEKGGHGTARPGKAAKAAAKAAKAAGNTAKRGEQRPVQVKAARATPLSGGPAAGAAIDAGAPDEDVAQDTSA
jgi:PPK2 family polyphosphate:nucleotide phosphotransferase